LPITIETIFTRNFRFIRKPFDYCDIKEVLSKLETILDPRIFYRIHRNMTVNMLAIDTYQDGVIIIDEKEFLVSIQPFTDLWLKNIILFVTI
jgi:hypothetical protein